MKDEKENEKKTKLLKRVHYEDEISKQEEKPVVIETQFAHLKVKKPPVQEKPKEIVE